MGNALIIGASSGIGRALAKKLAMENYTLGLVSRRLELLKDLQQEIPSRTFVKAIDISRQEEALSGIEAIIHEMGGVDLIVINAGTGFLNPELDLDKENETILVNVSGFCALATQAYRHFSHQGHGHIVGVSSIGALRGNSVAPAYNASKAFMSNYMEGLRKKAVHEGKKIIITDVKPGAVDTDMLKGEGHFWIASPEKAASQIFSAIRNEKSHAYVTKRWRLVAWALKILPSSLYNRI